MARVKNPITQLPLHLPLEAARAREDLIVSAANRRAIEFLDAWPEWPGPLAVLAGPVGSGKTHLAQVWAARVGAEVVSLASPVDISCEPDGPLVVEDLAQGSFSEASLFHLINAARGAKASLLLTSRKWPGDWGISLPDLRSRMKLATLLVLGEPDDALLKGVLVKLFADRQLMVEPSVVDYLTVRMERSLSAAQEMVDTIDTLSLASKRKVTKPLAAEAMRELGLQD